MKTHLPSEKCRVASDANRLPPVGAATRHLSPVTRHGERGIALVITLIMLSVTLVMAVAFLALANRERRKASTAADQTTARLAADTAVSYAQAQIAADLFSGLRYGISSNAYNLRLLVSTNYINPAGFTRGSSNPTNVNYEHIYGSAAPLAAADFEQNVANLYYLPRAPVMTTIDSNTPAGRFYLALHQNGRFETNYFGLDLDSQGNVLPGQPYLHTGDPEWIGVLQHPDQPHSAANPFIARYAFIALPVGNSLDINYIHNEALTRIVNQANGSLPPGSGDGYFRNQGVGSWELNLAAFLADLNTNYWGQLIGSSAGWYQYNQANPTPSVNRGSAFDDARALLSYRYGFNYGSLATADAAFRAAPTLFPHDGIDAYSDGPLQVTLNTNEDLFAPNSDGDLHPNRSWPGSDNTNHYFTLGDFYDPSKVSVGTETFTTHLRQAGSQPDTYDRYTFYRMLDQLGTDSSAEEGKLNLNYSNAVVQYRLQNGVLLPASIGVVPGAETNLVPWTSTNFFIAAADKLLRLYTANWFQANPTNYLATYYARFPLGYLDSTGIGITNVQYFWQTNQIPAFGITNIPVYVNSNFVYTPAVNRLLQLAANLYDASTETNRHAVNGNPGSNLPHVFKPILEKNNNGDVFIVG